MGGRRVLFLLLEDVEILDVAGPLQVLSEANLLGADYEIRYCSETGSILTDQGIFFAGLEKLIEARENDLIFVPGMRFASLKALSPAVFEWLRVANEVGARFYSICTGAFVLGQAGLLDGKQCTTHGIRARDLQERFPRSKVIENRLFVTDGAITTSAGIAAGIDLALSTVEEHYGAKMAAAVAREMVVYFRREGSHRQESVYLNYRSHLHNGVHRVQDHITSQPEKRETLAQLAEIANMSERNLTRMFRQATGISIGEYTNRLRLEMVKTLALDPQLSIETIAHRCGFESSRQLRRIARQFLGVSLSVLRKK